MTRTVLATPYAPSGTTGGSRRVVSLLTALARIGDVALVYVPFGDQPPSADLEALDRLTMVAVTPSRRLGRLRTYARARAAGAPVDFARGASPELAHAAVEAAGANGRIVADGLSAAASLLDVMQRRPVIYGAQNLESAFRGELAGGSPSGGLERFERTVLERAAQTWIPSPREVELAHALAASADVRCVPNVVDVAAIAPVAPRPGTRRLLFAADHTYPPNRDALGWLLGEIMPAVWARAPETTLTLTGRGLPAGLQTVDPRIEPLGFVDDLAAVYRASDAVVVPLRQGGGSPLKFIEALAWGLPVVATPKAAAGLELTAGDDHLQGETAAALADGVARALGPDGDRVGAAGRRAADTRYSLQTLEAVLRSC